MLIRFYLFTTIYTGGVHEYVHAEKAGLCITSELARRQVWQTPVSCGLGAKLIVRSAENVDAYDRGFSLKHVACVVSSMIETDLYKVRVKEISGVL